MGHSSATATATIAADDDERTNGRTAERPGEWRPSYFWSESAARGGHCKPQSPPPPHRFDLRPRRWSLLRHFRRPID